MILRSEGGGFAVVYDIDVDDLRDALHDEAHYDWTKDEAVVEVRAKVVRRYATGGEA